MNVQGCDCLIVFRTFNWEMDVPYIEETIREDVALLVEEAALEGDGVRRGIRKSHGVTGCVVTPVTIRTAPLLLYLAMGAAGNPAFVSETRNIYQCRLDLMPEDDSGGFDLIQDRNGERRLFEACWIKGFELRILRDEAVKLKLDICGEFPPAIYPFVEAFKQEMGERFNGDFVTYAINGQEYKNIYGLTLSVKKDGGTKTELWIKRALERGPDLPEIIDEMTITAKLLRDTYEPERYGTFCMTIRRLIQVADETDINSTDTVIGPLRYYVTGTVSGEVFTSGIRVIT